MGNQIKILNQELQNTKQVNAQEIVNIVVETLEKVQRFSTTIGRRTGNCILNAL